MKILGIESASMTASVAVVSDGILTAEYTVNYKKTHSQTLMPMLDEIFQTTELDRKSLDAVAVSSGPGSFTGLRIGAASAKGICMALNIPLVPVPTLDALAYNFWGTDALICPVMDARRGQVYGGLYRCAETLHIVEDASAISAEELVKNLNKRREHVIFAGDGEQVVLSVLKKEAQDFSFSFAPPSMGRHRAGSVASLGAVLFSEGKMISAEAFVPNYLKASQAERERERAIRLSAERELVAGIVPKVIGGCE